MTIEATVIEFSYTGDGSTVDFPFPAKFQSNADIHVGVNGVEIFTGFSVLGEGVDSGGTVTFNVAPVVGADILLVQKPPLTQLTNYPAGGRVLETTLEAALDKLTRIVQYLDRVDGRSLRLGDFDTSTLSQLPDAEDRAGQNLGFDTNGDVVVRAQPTVTIASEYVFNTHAALAAATITGAGTSVLWVGLAGRLVQGDHAFMIARYAAAAPAHTGYVQSADGAYWVFSPGFVTADMQATNTAAVRLAYTLGVPYVLAPGEQAKLQCNPTTDDIRAMSKWVQANVVGNHAYVTQTGANLWIELADGAHALATQLDIHGPGLVDYRATAVPDEIAITALSFATVSGTLRSATVTVASALPARCAVGYPIGLQNVYGDGGARAVSGGHIVTAIAGDRLSFTVQFHCTYALPAAVTTIDTIDDPNYGGAGNKRSQVIIPKCLLKADVSGWSGTADEGFLNVWGAANVFFSYVGLCIGNAGAGAHELVFARGNGAYIHLVDKCVFAGASTNGYVFRQYGSSEIHVNRSCIGCAGLAASLSVCTEGGRFQLVRVSLNGGTSETFSVGAGCHVTVSQTTGGAGATMFNVNGVGAFASIKSCRFFLANIAVDATIGLVLVDAQVTFDTGATAMNWLAGGFIIGNPTIANYATVSISPANTRYRGGGWYKSQLRDLAPYGERVSIANNTRQRASLTGVGGKLEIACETALGCWAQVAVRLSGTPCEAMGTVGSEVVVTAGGAAVAVGTNPGKVTFQVYLDTGVYYLNIVNEDGGTRAFGVRSFGNLALDGTFGAH